jgi:hypothetical protein
MTFEAPSTHGSTTSELVTGRLMAKPPLRGGLAGSSGKVELSKLAAGGDSGLGEDVA